jgi:glycosyltransferase involved in cell wall biosynthesis/ubiquinone/menaquinone biosynthesis C-methylase UbiE
MAADMPAQIQRLRRLIRAQRIDLVQIGGLVNPHAAIAARLEHVPVVWQLLDTRAPRVLATASMVWVRALADVVMSTGLGVSEWHPGYAAIADRVITFSPPVDLERFAPRPQLKAEVRHEWGISEADTVVGCVANINPQKGIIGLVRAFAGVRRLRPESKLVLVGAEYATHIAYSGAVRAEIASHGLVEGRDVLFLGGRNDVDRQMAGMDVVALAAVPRSEGITTAILESMACGLPVVVTDVGAIREAVSDGQSGFVIRPGDTASFSMALDRLLADSPLRARMGREGRRVAEERFGVSACVDTHVRAYTQALAVRERAPFPALTAPLEVPRPVGAFTSIDGIKIYLETEDRADHDDHCHDHPRDNKASQAEHFDLIAEEAFETNRPWGTPRLYRFLLDEKFRRAIGPIRHRLKGASALTVCGGSGMDAEYLTRAGALVTTSDLSLGAAVRARNRAAKHNAGFQSIVADVEHLPYEDESVDLVAVHDGLHHLEDPYAGLAEMARVAKRWLVVSEPAQASLTRLAIRLGLALEIEDAGNRVARIEPSEVAAYLEARGFAVLRNDRYAMYYPHRPGAVFRFLSRPILYTFVLVSWRVVNGIIGRFGNKMVIVAERVRPGCTGERSAIADAPPASRPRSAGSQTGRGS